MSYFMLKHTILSIDKEKKGGCANLDDLRNLLVIIFQSTALPSPDSRRWLRFQILLHSYR